MLPPIGPSEPIPPSLISFLEHVRTLLPHPLPLAVAFDVSSSSQIEQVGRFADGVVVAFQLNGILKNSVGDDVGAVASAVEAHCRTLAGGRSLTVVESDKLDSNGDNRLPPSTSDVETSSSSIAGHFGPFGGTYVPEPLVGALSSLSTAYDAARLDPTFWKEWEGELGYMNRPSGVYEAKRLTEKVGGARIWLKREDLNHTGSHKVRLFPPSSFLSPPTKLTFSPFLPFRQINRAIGQILLARRMGKTRIIAETGAGQHGVRTATVAAKFGMECVVYMGEEDARRQSLNVSRMRMLGAKVVEVKSGTRTLKNAVSASIFPHVFFCFFLFDTPPHVPKTLPSPTGSSTSPRLTTFSDPLSVLRHSRR
jgi:tryptophan synthase